MGRGQAGTPSAPSRVAGFVLATPAGNIAVVWTVAMAFYAWGPVRYLDAPHVTTWAFIGACLVAFASGSLLRPRFRAARVEPIHRVSRAKLEGVIRATALLGLFGGACIAFDKIFLSGLDYSQGVTVVRFQRADAVNAGAAVALPRSPLLYLGYFTFAFSVASYLLFMLKGEMVRRSTGALAAISLASPFAYSFVYGGRSPLFLVIGMGSAAIAVRLIGRSRPIPNRIGAVSFIAFIAITFGYSNWILSERFVETCAADYAALQERFTSTYGASIAPLAAASEPPTVATGASGPPPSACATPSASTAAPSLSEQISMQTVMNVYYVTHEVPMLDRTLSATGQVGPYYGAYEFYLVAAFAERVVPSLSVDAVMIPQLKAANVYGWFSTAWGGMYLDFGLTGAIIAAALCGWLAGVVYRRALSGCDDGAQLIMCYVFAGILASPILSIFTISISLPILVSLVATAWLLHSSVSPPVRSPGFHFR